MAGGDFLFTDFCHEFAVNLDAAMDRWRRCLFLKHSAHNHSDYASESIMPRSPICMNCGGRGRITERVTENADGYGECPYGNSAHHKEVMRGYYYCESCNEPMGSTIVARRIVCADCNFGNHWTYL